MKKIFSPRVIFAIFIILGFGISFWIFVKKPAEPKEEVYVRAGLAAAAKSLTLDSDSDGLYDWEEILRGTDPHNPDTDGDGISDKDEIIESKSAASGADGNQADVPNLTEVFSKTLSQAFGERILQGEDLRNIPASEIGAAASYLPEGATLVPAGKEIKEADLIISEKDDPASEKKYYNDVARVYKNTVFTLEKSDLTIMYEVYAKDKKESLPKMFDVLKALDAAYDEIKNIPVPRKAADFAVKEINYIAKTRSYVEIFAHSDADPLRALATLKPRTELLDEVKKFHDETGEKLKGRGIIFGEKDAGKIIFE